MISTFCLLDSLAVISSLSFIVDKKSKKYLLAKVNPMGIIYFGVLIALLQDSVTIFEVKLIKFR